MCRRAPCCAAPVSCRRGLRGGGRGGCCTLGALQGAAGGLAGGLTAAVLFIYVFISLLSNRERVQTLIRQLNPLGEEVTGACQQIDQRLSLRGVAAWPAGDVIDHLAFVDDEELRHPPGWRQ